MPRKPLNLALEPDKVRREALGKIADLLDRSGIDLDEIGAVEKINVWQGMFKNAEGEAETVDMAGISLRPKWAEGPSWPLVDQPKPIKVPTPPKPVSRPTGLATALILPDTQIGYRFDPDTGVLDPFHDDAAMAAALKVCRLLRPEVTVLLGDVIDLPNFSRFTQEPAFAFTTQPALDRTYRFLNEIRACTPGEIWYFEGNHDRRLQNSIINNAQAAFGLRRAETPEGWPVMSLPYLLRMDELGVEYIGGYPAGIKYLNDALACMHGYKVTSGGSTVTKVVKDEEVSIIHGHIHRIEQQYRTRQTRNGPHTIMAASPGCLCRTSGQVPSMKGSTDVFGRAVPNVEDWQQGVGIVTYEPEGTDFALEIAPIINGEVWFRGERLS